jgi:asparagine synthase (glutamine-hydrolysing)
MCGIAGQLRLTDDAPPIDLHQVQRAVASIAHRGPDDTGIYQSPTGRCVLGHRRLSVIDLACGHQPLGNEDGSVQVVFNGEIYNFGELRSELLTLGHLFRTKGDTEVLVHGWEQWGEALPSKLRGMFSFAVWDERQGVFFAARDPVGKKPLYYAQHQGVLRFGSEAKAILADDQFPRAIDHDALGLYLAVGYVPDPWSAFAGLNKLSPGHWLRVERGVVTTQAYWQPPIRPTFTGSFNDAIHRFRQLFEQAVRRRLIADVPLGAFLSGGIDSTAVVGTMAQLAGEPVKTFTISFEDARFDEAPYARLVAERFGTSHHELTVRPDAVAVIEQLANHFDEPFADSSAVPTYYVSKLTREHVTVALTGDGGDELFGGYRRYRAVKIANGLSRIPGGRAAAAALGRLLPTSHDRASNLGRAARVLAGFRASPAAAYLEQMSLLPAEQLGQLLAPDFARQVDRNLPDRWFTALYNGGTDSAAAPMRADLLSYLPGDILTKVDRASMAVALECRSPFLDVDLVDFACSLPTEWRLRGLLGHKHIVRHTLGDLLPPAVTQRRKAGFAIPLADWLRGPLQPILRDTLLAADARTTSILHQQTARRLADEHQAGHNHSAALWALLMLELWMRRWMA